MSTYRRQIPRTEYETSRPLPWWKSRWFALRFKVRIYLRVFVLFYGERPQRNTPELYSSYIVGTWFIDRYANVQLRVNVLSLQFFIRRVWTAVGRARRDDF